MSDLRRRAATSCIAVGCMAVLIRYAPHPYAGLLLVIVLAGMAAISAWEYIQLAYAKDLRPSCVLVVTCTIATVAAFYLSLRFPEYTQLTTIVLFLSAILFFLVRFKKFYNALTEIAVEFFGVCYAAMPFCFMLGILFSQKLVLLQQDGRWWLAYLIVVTKITDTAAYFVGKLWGKHSLAPLLSPKKTIEGALGGFGIALLTSLGMCWMSRQYLKGSFDLPLEPAIWMGILIGTLGQIGDLAESLLKRDALVKDSNKLPGLGGVLDMMDSLTATSPVVYFYLFMYCTEHYRSLL